MADLSVIIPSHNDIYLYRTIDSLLEMAAGDVEIVVVYDGYKPKSMPTSSHVIPVIHEENRGMREAINTGVSVSSGKYIMRSDEHCKFGPEYDRLLLEQIEDNWVVVPRRYKLNPTKWEVMGDEGYIDYEKLLVKKTADYEKFTAVEWKSRGRERKDMLLDETMAMQGSCYLMARSWWDKVIGRLQTEGYGPLYQDTTEIMFKTWRAGGKLMLNKKTWYAHKHRMFNRTHHYPVERAIPEWRYALDTWALDYQMVRAQWGL